MKNKEHIICNTPSHEYPRYNKPINSQVNSDRDRVCYDNGQIKHVAYLGYRF